MKPELQYKKKNNSATLLPLISVYSDLKPIVQLTYIKIIWVRLQHSRITRGHENNDKHVCMGCQDFGAMQTGLGWFVCFCFLTNPYTPMQAIYVVSCCILLRDHELPLAWVQYP